MPYEQCEHCGRDVETHAASGVLVHVETQRMSCGSFYTTRARIARDTTSGR